MAKKKKRKAAEPQLAAGADLAQAGKKERKKALEADAETIVQE